MTSELDQLAQKARDQAGLLRLMDEHAPLSQSHEATAKTLDGCASTLQRIVDAPPGLTQADVQQAREEGRREALAEIKPKWTDIKDEAPSKDEPIVYRKPKGDGRWSVGIAYWTVSEKWNPEMESQQTPHGFTHWMPLPDPDAVSKPYEPGDELPGGLVAVPAEWRRRVDIFINWILKAADELERLPDVLPSDKAIEAARSDDNG